MIKTCNKFNYNYIPVSITKQQLQESIDFAHAYVDDMKDHYEEARNQDDPAIILRQKITGTGAEFAARNLLNKFGNVTEPDTTIWEKNKKNYGEDLTFTGKSGTPLAIHVKSQELWKIKRRNYISFGFQIQDKLLTNPKINDYLFCFLVENDYNYRLVMKLNAKSIVGLYGDPVLKKFLGNKKFLYLKDVETAGIKPLNKK